MLFGLLDEMWYNRAMIEKVFRDPVHNYIHVDHQVIYDLINTKEFQRLRRIKQLGTSGYTFHGPRGNYTPDYHKP